MTALLGLKLMCLCEHEARRALWEHFRVYLIVNTTSNEEEAALCVRTGNEAREWNHAQPPNEIQINLSYDSHKFVWVICCYWRHKRLIVHNKLFFTHFSKIKVFTRHPDQAPSLGNSVLGNCLLAKSKESIQFSMILWSNVICPSISASLQQFFHYFIMCIFKTPKKVVRHHTNLRYLSLSKAQTCRVHTDICLN